ncbi:MAG: SPFH domain-containing protein [Patescibacteria group bacterium]
MSSLLFGFLFLLAALFAHQVSHVVLGNKNKIFTLSVRFVCGAIAVILISSLSFVFIGENETGHLHKIYGGKSLKDGAIVAAKGEKGPQADILTPGFHFRPLLRIIYKVSKESVFIVPEDKYGFLIAKDGMPMRPDQTYADAFNPNELRSMLYDARYFLEHNGQKGPQTTVLTPGTHRLNKFIWDIKLGDITEVPEGFVAVIKSNVWSRVDFGNLKTEKPENISPVKTDEFTGRDLKVPLVPVGAIGIWEKALNQGKYYINEHAYKVILFNTRANTWEYKGGYTKRRIDLMIDENGKITQSESSTTVPVPANAADPAIEVKVEGWSIPLELRALVQVSPESAPYVVASVGGLQEVEDNILTPIIRSVVRNVTGGTINVPADDLSGKSTNRPTRVLDLMINRGVLEQNIEDQIQPEGLKAGVDIKEIRFGDPAIPPELLLAWQREQLAQQLKKAYTQEKIAQDERITTEKAKATANQQSKLVESEIEVKRSEQAAMARQNEGTGEKNKLTLIAQGQKEQVEVLGPDKVVELRKYELLLTTLINYFDKHPEVLTQALSNAHKFVPERVFSIGSENKGTDLMGAAGILGDFLGQEKQIKDNSREKK